MTYFSDKSTVEFHFAVTVKVDCAPGVELNRLQEQLQAQLLTPNIFDGLGAGFDTTPAYASNKRVEAAYQGMSLGGPVERRPTADEMAEAEEEEIAAEREGRITSKQWSPEDDEVGQPMPSGLPDTHMPSVVPR